MSVLPGDNRCARQTGHLRAGWLGAWENGRGLTATHGTRPWATVKHAGATRRVDLPAWRREAVADRRHQCRQAGAEVVRRPRQLQRAPRVARR